MTPSGRLALFACLALAPASLSAAPGPFVRGGTPRSNVDQATATSVFTVVPVEGPIQDLDVLLTLNGGYGDNLRLTLVHGGTSTVLFEGTGNTPASYLDVLFDDEVANAVPTSGAVVGPHRPVPGTLSVFDGQELSGLWELRIENVSGAPGDGTFLDRFRLAGRVGYAGSPVVVALYDDPAFVDTADLSGDSEAEDVRAALERSGHDVRPFGGTGADRFADALAAADALVVPELDADLAASLDANVEQAITDFVAGGGVLIVHGDSHGGRGLELLNEVSGWGAVAGNVQTSGEPNPLSANVAPGTRFAGGVASVPGSDETTVAMDLPLGVRSLYQDGGFQTIVALATLARGRAQGDPR